MDVPRVRDPSNSMNSSLKYILIIAGIVLALLGLYFGSYLPLAKSRLYISTMRAAQSIRSVTEFEKLYDQMFSLSSPVGDEETVKFLSYDILSIISIENQPEEIARELVSYIEPHLIRNNVRHLLVGAQMYTTLWQNYKRESDYQTAVRYYRAAYDIGPKLPPVLFGLLQLYVNHGDMASANELGDHIVSLWPNALNPAVGQ
jgi:hypothetical protein